MEVLEQAILQYPLFGLFYVNLVLGLFNLLPAFPMDGGRVLRSGLAIFMGFNRATHLATRISIVLAIAMGIIGFFYNWILLLIAFFVYMGATYEDRTVMIKEALHGLKARDAMNAPELVLDSGISIAETFSKMEASNSTYALVIKGKGFAYIDLETISKIERKKWAGRKLSGIAVRVPMAKPGTELGKAFTEMAAHGWPVLPVVENHALIGVLDTDEINKIYKLHKLGGK
jgi:membrane-associated protease RseP (regulator of RpoE activity)